jgi:propanol-preferring alcohol dehydrogenase
MTLVRPGPIDSRPLDGAHVDDPSPAPDELLLRVAACAVCRTDLQICEGDVHAPRLPLVPGHQVVGHVIGTGKDVASWHMGDRAGIGWLGSADGTCDQCRAGRENLCPNARFTGLNRNGGYAELVTVRADFALRLPPTFSDTDAAPLLCGGVIGYRSLRLSGVSAGGRLGLFGFGASALLTLQAARFLGIDVYVVTRSEAERGRARETGATWAGGYDEPIPTALDGAITFAPVGSVVIAALRAIGPGGTVAVNAIHLDGIPAFDYDLLWRERVLRSVANYTRDDARAFLDLAAKIPIRPRIEEIALRDANDALARVSRGDVDGTPVLVPD